MNTDEMRQGSAVPPACGEARPARKEENSPPPVFGTTPKTTRRTRVLPFLFWCLVFGVWCFASNAAPTWQSEFSKMPLRELVRELNEKNVVATLLGAFQRNGAVKALVFMPGATDEFYFFHRARAALTNNSSTLFDAISALTNQTLIRATLRPPFLILHTAEDPLEPIGIIEDQKTADKIKRKKFRKEVLYNDRDWNFLHPILSFYLNAKFFPGAYTHQTNHFFRHSFAAFDLTGWEALEAVAMAGKTKFTVQKGKVIFAGDTRFLAKPPTPPNFLISTNEVSRPR